tara:strand:- start:162 stop:785 length:624 start_codon:yes stop_codon:yes gene_type:complete
MFLILDFTKSLKLAIFSKNILLTKELNTQKNISEILIIEVEKFLKKSKISINQLKSIYVITGPGSFTGIRSALTFAKSLKLTMKLNLYGLSKFEIINFKFKINKYNENRRIFLHYRDSQFFSQTFKGYKSIDEVRLINFNDEKLKLNNKLTYIYDNILFKALAENETFKKEDSLHLVTYNFIEINEIIINNMIDNTDPKPLYISNYY